MKKSKKNKSKKKNNITETTTNSVPCCENGSCDCEKPVARNNIKVLIFVIVALAVVGIVGFKLLTANENNENGGGTFGFGQSNSNSNPSGNNATPSEFGILINSFDELNDLAVNDDAVFVFIPDSEDVLIDSRANQSSINAQQSLKKSNVTVGFYTIQYGSSDYEYLAEATNTPAIAVMTKGGGVQFVLCANITEEKLLEAYLSSCDPAACDPNGCC